MLLWRAVQTNGWPFLDADLDNGRSSDDVGCRSGEFLSCFVVSGVVLCFWNFFSLLWVLIDG